ncbi:MAG: substrate-binding domain-containing protein [Verrucomicrobia bacterium]|nr:substrate-binding domain-containing protein [Verrucomicrobiota bacterium]MCH8512741.1 substrate-binding domain-containing protein [Kiritimatiellia bacterium]
MIHNANIKRIAGLMPTTFGYGREVMAGALNQLAQHPTLEVLWFQEEYPPVDMLREWKADGIIGIFSDLHPAEPYLKLGIPMVNTSSAKQARPVLNVQSDHHALGKLAAEHLVEKGLKHFAFLGLEQRSFSVQRKAGFAEGLGAESFESCLLPNKMWNWLERMWSFIQDLPTPCGLFCTGDNEARIFLSVCRAHGVRVPDDLVVIGGNNEEDICRSCRPQLSSISNRAKQVGEVAVKLLMERLNHPQRLCEDIVISPGAVIQRASSDILLTVDDPEIEAVLQFIRNHVQDQIDVEHVMRHFDGSRRTLENRFKKTLGRTPLAEIHRVRLNLIRQYLRDTDLPLTEVAEKTGIATINHLCSFFKKQTGLTPADYRAQSRRE